MRAAQPLPTNSSNSTGKRRDDFMSSSCQTAFVRSPYEGRMRVIIRHRPTSAQRWCGIVWERGAKPDVEPSRPALTVLSEDERLFRDSVYEFADREIRPLVREMDEHARIPPALIDKLFALGVMAIE